MTLVSIGSGYPLLVLQGGPGFSHHYLTAALSAYGSDYKFVLPFAANASGITQSRTFDEDVAAVVSAATELSSLGRFSVLAHSWGGLILCSALSGASGQTGSPTGSWLEKLETAVIVSPLPVDRNELKLVSKRFRQSLPSIVKLTALYQALFARNSQRMMQALLPYYGVSELALQLPDLRLNLDHYFKGVKTLGPATPHLSESSLKLLALITCGNDIVPATAIRDLSAHASRCIHIPHGSHFPMLEQPNEFAKIVTGLIPTSRRTA